MSESGSEPTQPIEGTPQAGWTGPSYGGPSYGEQQPGHDAGPMPPQTQPRQDDRGATPALVVGIVGIALGFVGVGLGFLLSPVAMVLGWRSKRRIDASHGQLGGRGNAQAGFILGLIGTILLLLGVLLVVGLVAAFVVHDSGGTF